MSDEFESTSDNNYSVFWPLFILTCALLTWAGYQDYAANQQRSVYASQVVASKPTFDEAATVIDRYKKLMSDLIDTSHKDQGAADIVKAAISAGLIRVQQPADTNAAANPAAPAPAPAK